MINVILFLSYQPRTLSGQAENFFAHISKQGFCLIQPSGFISVFFPLYMRHTLLFSARTR